MQIRRGLEIYQQIGGGGQSERVRMSQEIFSIKKNYSLCFFSWVEHLKIKMRACLNHWYLLLGGYDSGLARSINSNGSHNSEHYTGRGPGSASGSVFRSEDTETEPYLLGNRGSARNEATKRNLDSDPI
jgi:hypothetical protein